MLAGFLDRGFHFHASLTTSAFRYLELDYGLAIEFDQGR
jgi:hypothetical protein